MKNFFKRVLNIILFTVSFVVFVPIFTLFSVGELLMFKIFKLTSRYWERKKYNEIKVQKKLRKAILKELKKNGFFYLVDKYALDREEYVTCVNLKYLFTSNKEDFVYKIGTSKYLFNYYDFNAHKDGFVDKWIKKIQCMEGLRVQPVPKDGYISYRISEA